MAGWLDPDSQVRLALISVCFVHEVSVRWQWGSLLFVLVVQLQFYGAQAFGHWKSFKLVGSQAQDYCKIGGRTAMQKHVLRDIPTVTPHDHRPLNGPF